MPYASRSRVPGEPDISPRARAGGNTAEVPWVGGCPWISKSRQCRKTPLAKAADGALVVPHDIALRRSPELSYVLANNRRERLGGTCEHVGHAIHDAYFCCSDYFPGEGIVVRVGDKLGQSVGWSHRA